MSEPNDRGACKDPFEQVLEAVLSGDADARDEGILNDTLRIDPEARRQYVRAMVFEAMLASEFAPLEPAALPEVAARGRRWWVPLMVAAVVVLVAGGIWQSVQRREGGGMGGEDDISYAVITSLQDASGRFGASALVPGLRLVQGVIELDSGLAEITFDSGAEVTLEGPAKLELESDNRSRLSSGRASAVVPEQARGFVIHTPSSFIRDLGTAFSVEVRGEKETDLHVLEGEVEVAPTGRKAGKVPRILREKEAVRLSMGEMLPIHFQPENPGQKAAKRVPKVPPSWHWAFDSWDGGQSVDSERGVPVVFQGKGGVESLPEMVDGVFGSGLHFSGEGMSARTNYRAGGGGQAKTLAFWVCVQAGDGSGGSKPQGMLSWAGGKSAPRWQVLLNPTAGEGPVGAPRIEYGEGFAVGATDLRDGRWHHLALVILGGAKANVASHVRMYVDGKLEPISGRRPEVIQVVVKGGEAAPLVLGRYHGGVRGGRPSFFQGDIDELHVFEGPLLPAQIVKLMRRNVLGR